MKYRIKVTELHTDHVWVEADSLAEAKELAHAESFCEFECLYEVEFTGETEE